MTNSDSVNLSPIPERAFRCICIFLKVFNNNVIKRKTEHFTIYLQICWKFRDCICQNEWRNSSTERNKTFKNWKFLMAKRFLHFKVKLTDSFLNTDKVLLRFLAQCALEIIETRNYSFKSYGISFRLIKINC